MGLSEESRAAWTRKASKIVIQGLHVARIVNLPKP